MDGKTKSDFARIADYRMSWLHVLSTSLVLYFIGVFLLLFTANPVLFPTVSLIGSFAIPVAYVVFSINISGSVP